MCGIAGYIGKNPNKKILKKMTDRIAYRGPDSEGFYLDDKIALGHRRLAIIDLSTGTQPIYNEDKTKVIVFNGEIYNYQELRDDLIKDGHIFKTKTDTEVILHGYEKWGRNLTKYLRGMYAFAIWDKQKEELFLARDEWGIKPLYYYQFEDTFLFASEIKAFLDHPAFKKELNKTILSAYLCFNSTPTEETFFKGVYRLEPGTQMLFKKGKKKIETFFRLQFEPTEENMDTIVEKIKGSLENSVKYHEIADVEVGSFLSSGIDSSYLVSLARPDKTYTVGYDNPKYDEIRYAKDLADQLGIQNYSKKIEKEEYMEAFPNIMYHMDEPLADPAAIALYFVAGLAAQDVKVVLSGEGADELFAGYNSYQEDIDLGWYMKIPYFVRHFFSKIASCFPGVRGFNFLYKRGEKLENYHIGLGRVFPEKEAMAIVKDKKQVSTKEVTASIYKEYEGQSNLVKRQAIDFHFWLVHDFLHAVDRNTMMFGLEARTPFLDKEVYEVARKLPDYAKVDKNTTKKALRIAAKDIIPNEAYKKKKLGFPVPLREWIKEEDVYHKIKIAFASEISLELFDNKKIVKLLEEHKKGKRDNYKKIWTIYTFIVWYQVFFS